MEKMKIEGKSDVVYAPLLLREISKESNWDIWLDKVDTKLKSLGYIKHKQNYKKEDFAYWKTHKINNKPAYQIGLLFYDFRKYAYHQDSIEKVSVQFECLFAGIDSRIDLSVSKNITLEQFEEMALTFHSSMSKYVYITK
jgi:hypothetical protein